jgi:ring-1,2-phenylacetyl-CoA epoxidase subunit PaaE
MFSFFKKKKTSQESLLAEAPKKQRPTFNALKVSNIKRETADCVSVAFEIPETLRENYRFVQGQYLTFKKAINGEEIRRSYSICSSPLEGELRVAIKKVPEGRFSTYANDNLKEGDVLETMTPEGNFFRTLSPKATNTYVAFAAGSGITPIMSIIKATLEVEPNSKFILFYGNKSSKSIIFKEEIEDLKDAFLNRFEVHHVLSREDQGTDSLKGRIDGEKCKLFASNFFDIEEVSTFYLCGPEEMILSVKDTLIDLGAPKENVLFELFTTPVAAAAAANEKATKQVVTADKNAKSDVTVILDGDETHFQVTYGGNTVLDAALDAGADVPFACKGAVCCTCRAKVLEGTVEMDMNYALEEDELEAGYVLTCQSHPTSERVVISFDE